MALTLSEIRAFDDEKDDSNDNSGQKQQRSYVKKPKYEFKIGAALPNNGACKHYKSSFRYFRFPCCGKAFPCDDCHDATEKHEMEVQCLNLLIL